MQRLFAVCAYLRGLIGGVEVQASSGSVDSQWHCVRLNAIGTIPLLLRSISSFEVCESVMFRNVDELQCRLHALVEAGLSGTIDFADFGMRKSLILMRSPICAYALSRTMIEVSHSQKPTDLVRVAESVSNSAYLGLHNVHILRA